jgi:hypothetical protein
MINTGRKADTEFNDAALTGLHEDDENKAAEILLILKRLFDDRKVSSKRELNDATRLFCTLEGLHINRRSDAYGEIERLKRVWKTRQMAQADIDRWMIQKGYPLY